MTERLDRIESLLLATAERLNETNAALSVTARRQQQTAEDIDTLLGAVSTNETEMRSLTERMNDVFIRIDESNQRFEILRQEAAADRERADARHEQAFQQFQAMQENIERLYLEMNNNKGRIDSLEQADDHR